MEGHSVFSWSKFNRWSTIKKKGANYANRS
jgi:hypothetical protein